MKSKVLTTVLLWLCLGLSAWGQVPAARFDSLCRTQFSANGPGAVVLLARNGKVLYENAFGMANIEQNLPMRTTDVFRIGSNTKQFTAVAILQLAEAGRLSLQDDITKYIPDYPTNGKTITIENLLTHTSGIKNYTGLPGFDALKRTGITPAALVGYFKNAPPDFDPGTDFRYDNSGYILLGFIIEKVTGKPYGSYVSENLLKPAGMTNTYYDMPQNIIPGRISGYKELDGHYQNADFLDMSVPYAAGSLLSTADDLCRWYQALAAGRLISLQSLQKAWSSYLLPDGRPTGYGYGWFTGNVQGMPSVKHVGVVNGFVTYAAYFPVEKIAVVILTNSEATGNLDVLASELVAESTGKQYRFAHLFLPRSVLESFQGVYHTIYNGDKIVQMLDGHLEFFEKGGGKQELLPCGKDSFYIPQTLLMLRLERNAAGEVSGFTLTGTDMPLTAMKTAAKITAENAIRLSQDLLEQYVGGYQFSNFVLDIERSGDVLYGRVGNQRKELVPFAPDKFFAREMDATLIFTRDPNEKVSGMIKIQNSEMIAKRLP